MNNYLRISIYTILLLTSTVLFAQEDEEPDLPPGDPGEVPIDSHIPLLVAGAIVAAYRFLPKAETDKV